jgi:hypothetical protein
VEQPIARQPWPHKVSNFSRTSSSVGSELLSFRSSSSRREPMVTFWSLLSAGTSNSSIDRAEMPCEGRTPRLVSFRKIYVD